MHKSIITAVQNRIIADISTNRNCTTSPITGSGYSNIRCSSGKKGEFARSGEIASDPFRPRVGVTRSFEPDSGPVAAAVPADVAAAVPAVVAVLYI